TSFSPLSFLYGETSQTLVAKISPTSYQISFDPFPFCYNILRFSEKSASSQRSMAVYVDQTQQIGESTKSCSDSLEAAQFFVRRVCICSTSLERRSLFYD
ncbi:hypothetical protein LINPERHAP1_LOCUS22708, partial [Linum perenne]